MTDRIKIYTYAQHTSKAGQVADPDDVQDSIEMNDGELSGDFHEWEFDSMEDAIKSCEEAKSYWGRQPANANATHRYFVYKNILEALRRQNNDSNS